MSFLIDSDRVADFLNGKPDGVELFRTLAPAGFPISVVMTYGEILDGVYYGRDPARHEAVFTAFLVGVAILPVTASISERFARIRGDLRRRGQLIGDLDILIGATALEYNLTIVTRNRERYERIPGLSTHPS